MYFKTGSHYANQDVLELTEIYQLPPMMLGLNVCATMHG